MEGDKEKYTKALDRARNIYGASENKDILSTLSTIFPELKESEDERIKTNIIKLLRFVRDTYHQYSDECDEAIAWVEKQGEHANFRNKIQVGDRVTRNEDGVLVNLSQLNRVAEPAEKQRKQKPTDKVEPKFKVGDKIKLAEEPKYPAREIIAIKNDAYCFDKLEQLPFIHQDKWELVEQTPTDKIEQNPAWSEEDEERLSDVVFFVREYQIPTRDKRLLNTAKGAEKWLNSLKERYTWKPSDEQIESLQESIGIVGVLTPRGEYLRELLEQLKKLKEE